VPKAAREFVIPGAVKKVGLILEATTNASSRRIYLTVVEQKDRSGHGVVTNQLKEEFDGFRKLKFSYSKLKESNQL
jgi:hypothetical protein